MMARKVSRFAGFNPCCIGLGLQTAFYIKSQHSQTQSRFYPSLFSPFLPLKTPKKAPKTACSASIFCRKRKHIHDLKEVPRNAANNFSSAASTRAGRNVIIAGIRGEIQRSIHARGAQRINSWFAPPGFRQHPRARGVTAGLRLSRGRRYAASTRAGRNAPDRTYERASERSMTSVRPARPANRPLKPTTGEIFWIFKGASRAFSCMTCVEPVQAGSCRPGRRSRKWRGYCAMQTCR